MTTDVTQHDDRFEISVDGTRAGLAQFVDADGRRIFFHTEVGDEYSGQGLAGSWSPAPSTTPARPGCASCRCASTSRAIVEKHDEYADLVDPVTRDDVATVRRAQQGA